MACKWQPCFPQLQVLQLSIHSPLQLEPHETTAPHLQLFTSTALHLRLLHSKPQITASVVFLHLDLQGPFLLTYTRLTVWQVELLFTKQNRNDLSKKFHYKKVVGLYETYKKYEKIGGPNSYQNREKWTSVFLPKNLQKFKYFFSEK